MANKECECKGLSLIMDIIAFHASPDTSEKARRLVWDTYAQLNQPLGLPIKPGMADQDGEKAAQELERLLDKTGISDPIKQLLTCGPILTDSNMTETTKILKKAFELLAEGKNEEAMESLKKYSEGIECPIESS